VALFKGFDGKDRTYLEALGIACDNKASEAYFAMSKTTATTDPLTWSEPVAKLAWRLHPKELAGAFAKRAQAKSLSAEARKEALVALSYIPAQEAADAMIASAAAMEPGMTKGLAEWWLMNRKDNLWKDFGLGEALKKAGIYDPDTVVLSPIVTQPNQEPKYSVDEVMKLTGDAKSGAIKAQTCFACHKLGDQGVDFAPNLDGWAQRQTKEVLLKSIIQPNADIAHGFDGKRITLKDDSKIDGIVLSEGDPVLIQSMGGLLQRVPANRIKNKGGLNRSLMLTADEMGLSPQDVADIAAYLQGIK
jgi:putative heme-binding domain-containing protein